jgi:ribosomal protein S18 acetylase RimI-like enzyme
MKRAAASMIELSFEEYYGLLPIGAEPRLDAIAGQLGMQGTEIDRAVVALRGRRAVGVYAALPAAGLGRAQMLGALKLAQTLAAADRRVFLGALAAFGDEVPPVPDSSFYLSRLAVDPNSRGAGIGAAMLADLQTVAAKRGCQSISVHVRADNEDAVRFYRTQDFEVQGGTDRRYLTMVSGKSIDHSSAIPSSS